MANDVQKILENMQGQLMDLRNELDGILDEAIPQKLDKPLKSIRATNEEVIDREMGVTEMVSHRLLISSVSRSNARTPSASTSNLTKLAPTRFR